MSGNGLGARRRAWRILAAPIAALVTFGALFVAAAPAFADTAVGNVGLCIGLPAPGGCDATGGGTTNASPGATVTLELTFTATSGLPAGKVIAMDSQGTFPNSINFSDSDSDYSVANVTQTETCPLDADITQFENNPRLVFVPMPAACAAAAGDEIILTAANSVLPNYVGSLAIMTSTQVDDTSVATNSLDLFTVPDAPQSPSATGGEGSVTISWSAPAGDGGSDVTGYNVYCSTSGTPSTADAPTATTDASTTSTEIDGLTTGTHETCIVTALNAAGESAATDPVAASATGVPSHPRNVYTLAYNQQIVVRWTRPARRGGTRITHSLVYCTTTKPAIVDPSDLCKTTTGTATSATLRGLTNGTRYYIRVAAENADGIGQPSAQVSAVPSRPPAPPRAVQAVPVTGGISLTWKAPSSDFGTPVQNYFAVCSIEPGLGDPVFSPLLDATTFQVEIDGLASGTPYYCAVVAINRADQQSRPSLEATTTPS